MDENKFAVLILTHGRAERVITYDKLRQQGYTGKIYLIIDDEDEQKDAYFKKFGEQVIMFSKSESAAHVDTADNLNKRNVVVFARNECHRIAGELGLTHFLELDDDYSGFMFRRIEGKKMTHHMCKNLDRLFSDMCEFLDTSGALTIAFAQGGDFRLLRCRKWVQVISDCITILRGTFAFRRFSIRSGERKIAIHD